VDRGSCLNCTNDDFNGGTVHIRHHVRRGLALVFAVTIAVGVAACSGTGTPAKTTSSTNGTLTIAETVGPQTFDPQATSLNATWLAWELSYQCLLSADEKGKFNPVLATSYDVSKDGLTYTFHLRKGVTFQDGSPFTSDDVVFTFQRLQKTGLDYFKTRFANVTAITAPDPMTAVFTLKQVDPGFLLNLSDPSTAGCAILSRKATSTNDPALKMIGTGPFAVTDYAANSQLSLTRYDGYWGDKPAYKNLVVRYMPDASAQVAALQSGQVDLIFPAGTTVKTLQTNKSVKIEKVVSGAGININLNSASPALSDVRVRQAILLAMDREEIVNSVLLGGGAVAGPIPVGYSWAPKTKDVPNYTKNVAKAKQLLSDAGYGKGLTIDFQYIADYNDYIDRLATVMQKQLAAVGITLTLKPLAQPVWLQNLSTAQFDLSYNGYPFFADPLYYVLIRPGRSGPTPPELDAAVAAARAATKPDDYINKIIDVAKLEGQLGFGTMTLADTDLWVAHRAGIGNVVPKMDNTRQFLFDVTVAG
jgi:peptide/nickel transport system substrate-binding protein